MKATTKINTTTKAMNTQIKEMTKKELVSVLVDALPAIKDRDKNLFSRVDYTAEKAIGNLNSVPKSTLVDLCKEVFELLDKKTEEKPDNSLKPKKPGIKPNAKAEPAKEQPTEDKPKVQPKIQPKTEKAKKPANKAKEKPKANKATQSKEVYANLMATLFPETLEEKELGTLHRVDDITTMDELRTALNDEERNLYFCCYWDKKLVKQFDYKGFFDVPAVPEFPLNLDITQALYVCDSIDRVYAVSTYTEAMYKFEGEDIEVVDVELEDGDTTPIRYSNNMEYAIYELK